MLQYRTKEKDNTFILQKYNTFKVEMPFKVQCQFIQLFEKTDVSMVSVKNADLDADTLNVTTTSKLSQPTTMVICVNLELGTFIVTSTI